MKPKTTTREVFVPACMDHMLAHCLLFAWGLAQKLGYWLLWFTLLVPRLNDPDRLSRRGVDLLIDSMNISHGGIHMDPPS